MALTRLDSFDLATRGLHWEDGQYIDPVDGRVLPGASARGGVDLSRFDEVYEHGDHAHSDVPTTDLVVEDPILDGGAFDTVYQTGSDVDGGSF